jgi:hypothetical protein
VYHLLDSQCRGHKHVTRCSFSSETRAAVVAADELIAMSLTLHEVKQGPLTATEAVKWRDEGLSLVKTILTVDSMSLWSAVAAMVVRIPTEKNLAVHMFWLKELLVSKAISLLRWCDTRDMTADCHTKGSIDRACIIKLMTGEFSFAHPVKDYASRTVESARSTTLFSVNNPPVALVRRCSVCGKVLPGYDDWAERFTCGHYVCSKCFRMPFCQVCREADGVHPSTKEVFISQASSSSSGQDRNITI